MTISALIWILFYSRLGLSWFLGYLFIFFAIFTKFDLWAKLNVIYPKDNILLVDSFSAITLFLWIWLLSYNIARNKLASFNKTLAILWIFLLWIFIALSPWFIKNVYQTSLYWEPISISITSILGWKWETINTDLTNIYSEKSLETIEENELIEREKLNTSEKAWEDYGRYFGYEKGINNYLKFPYNLTMQVNQWWEFTDITYIYLALLPILLLFLSYRSSIYAFWSLMVGWLILTLSFFESTSIKLTNFFLKINIPEGYIAILFIMLLPLIYLHFTLKKNKISDLFKMNLAFTSFYVFLWTISAFWIIWYWISMFFWFLFIIAIWVYYMSYYSDKDTIWLNSIRLVWSLILLIVISISFLQSSVPHGFNNLKKAWFHQFKNWEVSQVIWIFDAHPNYIKVLTELNLGDNANLVFKESIEETSTKFQGIINNNIWAQSNIITLNNFLLNFIKLNPTETSKEFLDLKKEALNLREKLFTSILYPREELKNADWIYRIWTFLKYFTSENYNRFYEDSLVTNFDKYIYDENSDITVERLKKLWLKYLLVDLNAATIDRDPRHDLTRRYENLLTTFASDKLELIDTDSTCLKLALDEYSRDNDYKKYIQLAWVNYESYFNNENWVEMVLWRWQKQAICHKKIMDLILSNEITTTNYPYLNDMYVYLSNNNDTYNTDETLYGFVRQYIKHWYFTLFKVK